MRLLRSALTAAIFLAVAGLPAMLRADDDGVVDRDAIRAAQRHLRTQVVSQRVQTIEGMRTLPGLEAAKLLAPTQLLDSQVEIQRAAYQTLLTWKERREVCIYLSRILDKEFKGKKTRLALAGSVLAVLLTSDTPETQRDLKKQLDGLVSKGHEGAPVITTVADAWGSQGDQQAVTALQRMTGLKFFSDVFGCRRAVVQGLCAIRLPEAIDALVDLLSKVDGEVRGDIVRYLEAVTHQHFGINAGAWQSWWKDHREGFDFPAKESQSALTPAAMAGLPSYYGLPIQAKHLVFVVDISGSMEGLRINTLKRELTATIDALPAETTFNIVVFSTRVSVWQKNLVPATQSNKQKGRQYVYGLRPGGRTASYDALETAMGFDVEAIYFLSDGDPNAGQISVPEAIVAAVVQANRVRRISVYTIGICPGPAGGPLDNFMRSLAEQNLGIYRRVDH